MSRIMACRKSGLPDTRWCTENGIPPSSLYYWIKKLRMEAPEIPIPNHEIAVPYKQDVVPLHIIDERAPELNEQHTAAIVVRFNAVTLEIQNGANETTITNTINALRQLC